MFFSRLQAMMVAYLKGRCECFLVRQRFISLIVCAALAAFSVHCQRTPSSASTLQPIVVSIQPIYLLVSAITQGVNTPVLLLSPYHDGHHVQLSPKQLQQLVDSSVVFWLGAEHEVQLAAHLRQHKHAVALLDKLGEQHARRSLQGASLQGVATSTTSNDTHVWLDPVLVRKMAIQISQTLCVKYPAHCAQYQANLTQFTQRLNQSEALIQTERQRLYGTRPLAYVAYHDAFVGFESTLHLEYVGAMKTEQTQPTPEQLLWLQQRIAQLQQQKTEVCLVLQASAPAVHAFAQLPAARLDENFARYNDFVTAWSVMARTLLQCYGA